LSPSSVKPAHLAAEGPNTILGAGDVKEHADPVIGGMSILIADDEPNIRNTIADVLRKYHATIAVASCGCEAIQCLERSHYDLVISDIKMPDKSGYDVFAAAHKRCNTLPVILMTGFGYDPNHSIVRASQEGLQAVLFKPFKVEQLLAEVRRALQVVAAK
jgi:DNA-binding NtrC family response regulator